MATGCLGSKQISSLMNVQPETISGSMENRDRLKSANVADLTDAYCLLADRNNALVPDTKCQPQQAGITQTNRTLFEVSVEILEIFGYLSLIHI